MKKLFVVLALILTLALALTACGGGKSDVVKITLMQSKTEIQSDLQTVIDDFNEKHEDIEVELLGTSGDNYATVLQSNFAADPATAPTIFSMSGPDSVNFEKFMAALDDTEAAKILPDNLKTPVTVDGKLVGLPSAVEGYGLIYNADMLSEAGVDPASLTSIDALVSAFETLSGVEGVEAPLGFAKKIILLHTFFHWLPA
jgi:raffinose/stachyose/melibiose transport system substrate-binding protein